MFLVGHEKGKAHTSEDVRYEREKRPRVVKHKAETAKMKWSERKEA